LIRNLNSMSDEEAFQMAEVEETMAPSGSSSSQDTWRSVCLGLKLVINMCYCIALH